MKILQVVLNDFRNDNRVLRASIAASETGASSFVYALHASDLPYLDQVGDVTIQRFSLVTRSWPKKIIIQCLKYIELLLRMISASRKLKPTIVHAHDLNGLPIGYCIAHISGARLIYDSHELWSGRWFQTPSPRCLYDLAFKMESVLARKADAVITVCDSIALELRKKLRIPLPLVIRNIPDFTLQMQAEFKPNKLMHDSLGLAVKTPIILYQGAMFASRGLPLLVEAMKYLRNPHAVLVFMGNGPLTNQLQVQTKSIGLEKRIYFQPAVPHGELLYWTRCATVGVHPIEPVCQNHYYCLPNKLFEYIHAHLPVIVSDMPEMESLVLKYGVGTSFPAGDSHKLAETFDQVLGNKELLAQYKAASLQASKALTWQLEKQGLLQLYNRFLLDMQ